MRKFLLLFMVALLIMVGGKAVITKATTYDGKKLDLGIYWFGRNGENEKYVEGKQNKFFDNSKPTVIFFHGWQPDSTRTLKRDGFEVKDSTKRSSDYWIEKGWNIGIFYWNQFADEGEVKDAEAKIWSNKTSKALRWRKQDGSYWNYRGEESSVTDMFVNQYIKCMKNFTGNEIRLVGHSLGNQLAINSSANIERKILNKEISEKLRPNRVALLDPFWSKYEKDYLDEKSTGEACVERVYYLRNKGITFEEYKSSNINDLLIGDKNEEMKRITAFTDFYPDYISILDQGGKHNSIISWYFQSIAYEAPKEFFFGNITNRKACSASSAITRLREMMGTGYYWYQRDGKNTATPSDDTFELVAW